MYKLTHDTIVIRLSDGASIPPGHRWYDDYLEWVAAGNTPFPADPLPGRAALEVLKERVKALTLANRRDAYAALSAYQFGDTETAIAIVQGMSISDTAKNQIIGILNDG